MRRTKGILLLIAALLVCLTVIFVGCDSGNTNSDNSGGSSNNAGNVSNDSGNSSNDSGNKGDAKCSHNWSDATCTAPKTCTKCAATEGEALGHTWVDATCETAKTCSVCAETEGDALGHTWVDATCETAKTCSVCAETDGEALGHTWVDATCESAKTCSVCAETDGEELGHTWVDATCEVAKTCSVCAATEGDALGHILVEGICSNCSYRDEEYINLKYGQDVYSKLTSANAFCEMFASQLYDAWYFAIYKSDDVSIYSTGMSEFASYVGMDESLVDQAATEYLLSLGYSESQITSSNTYKLATVRTNGGAIYIVTRVFELSEMSGIAEERISESKSLIKDMSPDYEEQTALSTLKTLYSHVSDFYDFVTNPSGSFNQLATTVNSFKSDISEDFNDLEFIYE